MYRQFLFTPDFHQYKFQLTDKVRKIIQRYEHRIKNMLVKSDKSINCHKHVSNVYGKSELNRTDTRTNYHQRHLCMVDIWRWQTLARYLMTSQSICVNPRPRVSSVYSDRPRRSSSSSVWCRVTSQVYDAIQTAFDFNMLVHSVNKTN